MKAHFIGSLTVAVVLLARSVHCQSLEWLRQFGGPVNDLGGQVAVDAFGDIYVAGYKGIDPEDSLSQDFLLLKYNPTGELLWSKQYDFTRTDRNWSGLSTDPLGNVYFGGSVSGAHGDRDGMLVKVDSDGNQLWERRLEAGGDEAFRNIRADQQGSVFVSGMTIGGSIDGGSIGETDALVGKYDANGTQLWMRQFRGNHITEAWGLAADASGNVFVSGPAEGQFAKILSKFSASGVPLWERRFDQGNTGTAGSIAVDQTGNAFVAGNTSGSLEGPNAGGSDAFVRKYDSDGILSWTRQYGTVQDDTIRAITVGETGELFVAGITLGDGYLARLSATGDIDWSSQIGTSDYHIGNGVALGSDGAVYVAGQTSGHAGNADLFLAKFQPSILGDTNADGVVDLEDLNNVRNHFGGEGLGDTNGDGAIDLVDLNNVRNHFGAVGGNAVPEPSTAWLLVAGGVAAVVIHSLRRPALAKRAMRRLFAFQGGAIAAMLIMGVSVADAQTFRRIADFATNVPGRDVPFTYLTGPAISGLSVTFIGYSSGKEGVYSLTGDGPLQRVVETGEFAPNGTEVFDQFTEQAIAHSAFVFRNYSYREDGRPRVGFYARPIEGGDYVTIADVDTLIPGGFGDFNGMSVASVSEDTVVFHGGDSATQRGIYAGSANGARLDMIADLNTPLPFQSGGYRPSFIGIPSVSGSMVTFSAGDETRSGIYLRPLDGGVVNTVVDTTFTVPDSGAAFERIDRGDLSGNRVVFIAFETLQRPGFYSASLSAGGPIVKLADFTTAIPAGDGTFSGFDVTSLSSTATHFAFRGFGSDGQEGIYYGSHDGGGSLSKLIAVGDELDDRIIRALAFTKHGHDESRMAFVAEFTDGMRGVYIAILNTPGDTNADGIVDLEDLNNVRNHFGGAGLGDTNADGIVDLNDLNNVRNHFGAGGANAVPEPAAFFLAAIIVAFGGIGLLPSRLAATRPRKG